LIAAVRCFEVGGFYGSFDVCQALRCGSISVAFGSRFWVVDR
jgi:hypothetical protein